MLSGYALPITDTTKYRINIFIHTDPRMPWGAPFDAQSVATWRQAIGVNESTGQFPVHIWRMRRGLWRRVLTAWIPAASLQMASVPVPADFESGDLLIMEYNPGVMNVLSKTSPSLYEMPLASVIARASNDPMTQGFGIFPPVEITY